MTFMLGLPQALYANDQRQAHTKEGHSNHDEDDIAHSDS